MLKRLNKTAQTTAEYAVLIALVIGAVVAMQVYVRRGINGRIQEVVDHTGQGGDVGGTTLQFSGKQVEPYYLSSTSQTSQSSTNNEILSEGSAVNRTESNETTATQTQTYGWSGRENQE